MRTPRRLSAFVLATAFLALAVTAPVEAQVVKLYCQFTKNPMGYIVTVNHSARTMSLTMADPQGYPTHAEEQNMPATITESQIAGSARRGPINAPFEIHFTINRYSGVMAITDTWQGGSRDETKPCIPYKEKPPRKQKF